MKKIMNWILPKERKFLEALAEQSGNILQMSAKLKDFIESYQNLERSDRKACAYSIKSTKGRIDELRNDLMRKLSSISVPEREEINRIALLLDDIAGLISDCALKFVVLGIERVDNYILKLAGLLNESVEELSRIITLKKPNSIKSHYDRIKSIEVDAEETFNKALSELFHFYRNSIDIMKYREIYDILKNAVKKCRTAAEAVDIVNCGK